MLFVFVFVFFLFLFFLFLNTKGFWFGHLEQNETQQTLFNIKHNKKITLINT